ncbi:MAG: zinc ribbon domain-containing protein [Chloroflexi bacterium]|nr:zinc ribbon domain-containing protein [Chloroflexota bacterium]MBM4453617.1 zinc ribbon domain-containing protein [Chloroflexota bacterium]
MKYGRRCQSDCFGFQLTMMPSSQLHRQPFFVLQFESIEVVIMPIYEYMCHGCQHKVTLYLQTHSTSPPPCPQCGNNTLDRVFSTFAVRKTHKDVYDSILSNNQLTRGMMRNDPKALAEWNRRMSQGEPVAPEYEETVERMDRGEMPPLQMAGTGSPVEESNTE